MNHVWSGRLSRFPAMRVPTTSPPHRSPSTPPARKDGCRRRAFGLDPAPASPWPAWSQQRQPGGTPDASSARASQTAQCSDLSSPSAASGRFDEQPSKQADTNQPLDHQIWCAEGPKIGHSCLSIHLPWVSCLSSFVGGRRGMRLLEVEGRPTNPGLTFPCLATPLPA